LTLTGLALFLSSTHRAQVAPSSSPTYRIAGTVVDSKGGAPLAQARVFLTDVKNSKNVESQLTNDDGHFEFQAPAGKYALRGAKRGYISSNYNQHEQFSTAIVTGADVDTENLVLQLFPTAAIFGKVLDENGDPIRQATVTLWREDHRTGLTRIERARNEASDDRGDYEFAPLEPGTYFLSVSANPWYAVHPPSIAPEGAQLIPVMVDRSLDVVYPITYYAGATESDDATPIPIRGGDRQELELRLLPVPALHVLLRTSQKESGQTDGAFQGYPTFRKRLFDEAEVREPLQVQQNANGVLEVATAPGKYSLRMDGPQGARISEVDLSEDHQEIDAASGEIASNITVTLHRPDGSRASDQIFLGLVDHHGKPAAFQRVLGQDNAQFANIPPGTYQFSVGSPNGAYSVVRVVSQGRETTSRSLQVAAGTNLSVEIFLASGSARVEGIAVREGKPSAGAMIVLVPKNPEANRDLFRRDQSDLDGTFTLQAVLPGSYTILAIADGWDLDWSRPAVIAHYAIHGQTIEVSAHSDHPLKPSSPVEVQPK
jgi:5-hydroxyisourate hydrolase-like protein (transthyretin family)